MKILLTVGTRPNFVKIAPIIRAIRKTDIEYELIHTGQHYDWNMSQSFFEGLEIPVPDVNLGMDGNTYISRGTMMSLFADILDRKKPDMAMVVGDGDSTLACALVAAREGVKLVHVEAGLRSFDKTMPEEINRILTDAISDYLFVSEESGLKNLRKEGIKQTKIYFVGNVMIDSLVYNLSAIEKRSVPRSRPFILATFHRPSNVDSRDNMELILRIFKEMSEEIQIIVPLHPRTKKMLNSYHRKYLLEGRIRFTAPMGYLKFLAYMRAAKLVITDSGGIQEETTYLGVPCLTMRENTERPVTVEKGTNYLVGQDKYKIKALVNRILNDKAKKGIIPELWDGRAAERIVAILGNIF